MTPQPDIHLPSIEQTADLLSDIACELMSSGAHTMRILQNVSRMAENFGYHLDLSVFQLSVIITITNKDDSAKRLTLNKKTKPLLINYTFVSDLSTLSWDTYDKHLDYEEVKRRFHEVISQKRTSRWVILILVSFANASFCGLFKGDIYAMELVFLATLAGFFVRQEMLIHHVNVLVTYTTSAFVAGMTAGMGYVFHWGLTPEIALASCVLYHTPGVPLINSVLDIIEGHVLTGIARLVNASSLIICTAIGLFTALLLLGLDKL
jgi:uncharacterized membrane protein YjjP (DUF1212 family)